MTIQNAADLEWPSSDAANAGVRGEFLLGVFPPDHGGNSSPPTPPASEIDRKIQGYDGNINLVHSLVDNFFKQIPNAFKENRVLEREILPIRLQIKVEDVPVKRVTYTYKNKSYVLWVYGNENKVYASKHPREFTLRLGVELVIELALAAWVVYLFAQFICSSNE